MKAICDMCLVFLSLFSVCCLFPHLTGAASQLCSAGASRGNGCTLSAHCAGSGVLLEWETTGYPQVDVLHLEYQKNNGEHQTIVSYYLNRQGSHTFLAPEGGQVIWTFSGCYHDDYWTEFSVASLTLTCEEAAQEETDLVSEAQVSATSMLEASSTVQISSTVQASSTAQASSSLVQASSTITQPSSSIDSVGSPTHAQAVPTNIIISVLDIKSGIELENAEEQGKAFKSNKNSGESMRVSGREKRVAGDAVLATDSRMESRGLSNIANYFVGALLGVSVAAIVVGTLLVVARQHKQRRPALNI